MVVVYALHGWCSSFGGSPVLSLSSPSFALPYLGPPCWPLLIASLSSPHLHTCRACRLVGFVSHSFALPPSVGLFRWFHNTHCFSSPATSRTSEASLAHRSAKMRMGKWFLLPERRGWRPRDISLRHCIDPFFNTNGGMPCLSFLCFPHPLHNLRSYCLYMGGRMFSSRLLR